MNANEKHRVHHPREDTQPVGSLTTDKKPWQEPKLAFIEPKLTKHGKLEKLTGEGFFGGFTP